MTTEIKLTTSLVGNKNEKMQQKLKDKGIPALLNEAEFNFKDKLNELEDRDTLVAIIASIKEVIERDFSLQQQKQQLNYFKKLKFHTSYTAEMKRFKGENISKKTFSRIRTQLYDRLLPKYQERITKEELVIVKIIIKNGKHTQEGYSVLNGKLKSNAHREKGYYRYYDLTTLMAEVATVQSLLNFAAKNKRTIQYLFVEKHFDSTSNLLSTPAEKSFKNRVLKVAKKYNFNVNDAIENTSIDSVSHIFNVDLFANQAERITEFKEDGILQFVSKEFVRELSYIQYKFNDQSVKSTNYAKAFETLSTPTVKYANEMTANFFLKRYGIVEIDKDVCLTEFKDLQKHFFNLMQEIHIPYNKSYKLKIKKLGKYGTEGVFFPTHKTLVIDYENTHFYSRILGNQIDKMLADLFNTKENYYSQTLEFRHILNSYKRIILQNIRTLPTDKDSVKKWYSDSKYNKDFYFNSTQVFASCFEIYLSKFNLKNPLVRANEEFSEEVIYTLNSNFIELITPFFESIMETLKEKFPPSNKRTFLREVSDEEIKSNYIYIPEEAHSDPQLSLF
ncbi:hypothetical protein O0Q50_19425 [Priestia aryabhattai]|uniref:Uncharacterized protein n=1 Tax=Priestia aryabhattai TaxID=412384 RepID=A0AAX6NC90_PRIAR|nr:hypothetical protein [Priestia aryabhattai]MDU9693346.1 hypothetical protein [Priestia aryabhattai]